MEEDEDAFLYGESTEEPEPIVHVTAPGQRIISLCAPPKLDNLPSLVSVETVNIPVYVIQTNYFQVISTILFQT